MSEINSSRSLFFNDELSILFWFKASDLDQTYQQLLRKGGSDDKIEIQLDGDNIRVDVGDYEENQIFSEDLSEDT